MTFWKTKSNRKATGAKRHNIVNKRRRERGRVFLAPVIGPADRKAERMRGGHWKFPVARAELALVSNPSTGKVVSSKILTVVTNPANPNYVRRNILTKGAIIKTEAGEARITSRPGQHGAVQAVLIKK